MELQFSRVLREDVRFRALRTRYLLTWLRVVFLSWERVILKREVEAYTAEVENLKQRQGKSKNSIWQMSKADLVEVAERECGLSLAKAQKDTVEILREKIRTVRKLRDTLDDPLAAPPVGLGKMKLAELQDEVLKRDLPLPPDATRVQLQMLIREDADHRIMQSTPEASAMAAASSVMDEDFEMVPASRAKVKPSPKPKGYQNRSA